MASGIRRLAKSDIGMGVTGIAGPTGATEGSPEHRDSKYRLRGATKGKPVGLVYVAIATKKGKFVQLCRFTGNRREIKLQSSTAALDLLRRITVGHRVGHT